MNAPIELLPTWPLLYAISIKTGLFHVTCLTAVVQEKKKKDRINSIVTQLTLLILVAAAARSHYNDVANKSIVLPHRKIVVIVLYQGLILRSVERISYEHQCPSFASSR